MLKSLEIDVTGIACRSTTDRLHRMIQQNTSRLVDVICSCLLPLGAVAYHLMTTDRLIDVIVACCLALLYR